MLETEKYFLAHHHCCPCLGLFPSTEAVEGKGFAAKELDIDCGCNKGFGKHHDEGVYDPCPFHTVEAVNMEQMEMANPTEA